MVVNNNVGMILPITFEMYENLSTKKRFSLIKFTPNSKVPKYLKSKDKILLYNLGGIIGEGVLEKISVILPNKIPKKDLLLSKAMLSGYLLGRESRPLILFSISNFMKYLKKKEPLVFPVPPSGRYIKESEYSSLD